MKSAWFARVLLTAFLPFATRMVFAGPPAQSGCRILPPDNIWNRPVDDLPVHSMSATWVATIGASATVHPDFGAGLWDGGPIGIPFNLVPGTQPRVAVTFDYEDDSDPGPYPVPPNPQIEGGPASSGDRHILMIDYDHCVLYELYSAYPQPGGAWHAGSGAIFDLSSNTLRPDTWTSADAAGLPVFPGLIRYDEVAAGEIAHALRFTAPQTRRAYVWPATHYASSLTGTQYPPMGQRFRLKASFDETGFSALNRVILRALKTYGMFLADNGSAWYLSGAPDERWNNTELRQLKQLKGSDFEAVQTDALQAAPGSGAAFLPAPRFTAMQWNGSVFEFEAEGLIPYVDYRLEAGGVLASWPDLTGFTPTARVATGVLPPGAIPTRAYRIHR